METESTVTQTYLYITVSHKTADEMAAQYGFSEDQKEQLAELLADENNSLWTSKERENYVCQRNLFLRKSAKFFANG